MSRKGVVPEVTVRLARTAEEREQAFRLRYETYVAEMNLISSPDHAGRRLTDAYDAQSQLLGAYAGEEMVGTLRLTFGADGRFPAEFADAYGMDAFFAIVAREAMFVASRFAVSKTYRGTAAPLALIAEGTRLAVRRGVELAFCDCQPHLINMYIRLGFRPYRQTCNDPNGGLVVPLVMIFSDGDYLRRVRSPLLGTALPPDLPTSQLARQAASMLPPRPPVRSLGQVEKYDWSAEIAAGLTGQALRAFEDLDDSQLARVLAHSHVIDVAPASYLIRQGHGTRTMYVLLDGELQYQAGHKHLASAQIGEVVGDVAFFLQTPRTINVIAGAGGARVLSLNEPALRRVMGSHSEAAAILLFNLCRMLAARVAARTEEQ